MQFDKKMQARMREEYAQKTLDEAWRTFCQCDFLGQRIQDAMDRSSTIYARADVLRAEIDKIDDGEEPHSRENRIKKGALDEQARTLKKHTDDMGPMIDQLRQKRREQLGNAQYLTELAEFAKSYAITEPEKKDDGKADIQKPAA